LSYLYITHDVASARYIGDETIVMYAGRMVEGANSEELIAHPAHPYTELLLSAVPNPHEPVKKEIKARSEPPRLVDPPPGCPFAPRCPKVMAACREVMPGIVHISSNHWVRCHLYGAGETVG
jgi:peptide/nickel transport system ATP-binding protein